MTWIRVIPFDEDETLQRARTAQQALYPVEYAEQITRDATRISPAFHDRLRTVGFDDRGILQITLIASWFNYINRVADALGGAGRLT